MLDYVERKRISFPENWMSMNIFSLVLSQPFAAFIHGLGYKAVNCCILFIKVVVENPDLNIITRWKTFIRQTNIPTNFSPPHQIFQFPIH